MRSGIMTDLMDVRESARALRFEPVIDNREVNVQKAIEYATSVATMNTGFRAPVIAIGTSVLAGDDILLVNVTPAVVNLPLSSERAGRPLVIKDITGSATVSITINRNAGDILGIDTLASVQILTAMGGYHLTPVIVGVSTGWVITP